MLSGIRLPGTVWVALVLALNEGLQFFVDYMGGASPEWMTLVALTVAALAKGLHEQTTQDETVIDLTVENGQVQRSERVRGITERFWLG